MLLGLGCHYFFAFIGFTFVCLDLSSCPVLFLRSFYLLLPVACSPFTTASPAPQYGSATSFYNPSLTHTHTQNMKQIPCQRQQQLAPGITPALAYSWLSRWASSAPQFLVPPGAQHARSGQLQGQGFSMGAVFTTEFTKQRMSGGGRNHRAHLRTQSTNMTWTVTGVDAAQCMVRGNVFFFFLILCFFICFSLFNTCSTTTCVILVLVFSVSWFSSTCYRCLCPIDADTFFYFKNSHRYDSTWQRQQTRQVSFK